MYRTAAAVVSIALIAATLSPLVRDPNDDGYPLSTYPMFSWKRPTKLTMSYAIGETAAGERRYLVPFVVGSAEVLQARAIVERAVRAGRVEVAALCRRVATAVARMPRFADVTRIRVLTGSHDALEFLVHDRLGPEYERTRCEVKR